MNIKSSVVRLKSKRLLPAIRTACGCCILFLLTLPAGTQAEDYSYTIDNGRITITGYTGPGGAVTIPDTIIGLPVATIGSAAFRSSTSLTNVSIPDSVGSIGDTAFHSCSNLTAVTLGNGVSGIGISAFYKCTSLTSVAIPASVGSIGLAAFSWCSSLSAITVDARNAVYCSVDGVLLDKNQTTVIQCPAGKAGTCTLPKSVTTLGYEAFYVCAGLTAVYFQGNAPALGSFVFSGANNATVYYLPGTIGWESDARGPSDRTMAVALPPNPNLRARLWRSGQRFWLQNFLGGKPTCRRQGLHQSCQSRLGVSHYGHGHRRLGAVQRFAMGQLP